jgi:hypothetical protein
VVMRQVEGLSWVWWWCGLWVVAGGSGIALLIFRRDEDGSHSSQGRQNSTAAVQTEECSWSRWAEWQRAMVEVISRGVRGQLIVVLSGRDLGKPQQRQGVVWVLAAASRRQPGKNSAPRHLASFFPSQHLCTFSARHSHFESRAFLFSLMSCE